MHFSVVVLYCFPVMRDMFDNMYKVQIANSGDAAGFPRSHDGLEQAITLAFCEGTSVTLDGEVVWPASDDADDYLNFKA